MILINDKLMDEEDKKSEEEYCEETPKFHTHKS
jgi:hypothetical protein